MNGHKGGQDASEKGREQEEENDDNDNDHEDEDDGDDDDDKDEREHDDDGNNDEEKENEYDDDQNLEEVFRMRAYSKLSGNSRRASAQAIGVTTRNLLVGGVLLLRAQRK